MPSCRYCSYVMMNDRGYYECSKYIKQIGYKSLIRYHHCSGYRQFPDKDIADILLESIPRVAVRKQKDTRFEQIQLNIEGDLHKNENDTKNTKRYS